jgi:hypothetical protein
MEVAEWQARRRRKMQTRREERRRQRAMGPQQQQAWEEEVKKVEVAVSAVVRRTPENSSLRKLVLQGTIRLEGLSYGM